MQKLLNLFMLQESITHLEDLPLKEFIRTIESLSDKIVTEKLDGANLWFGLDENGVYTSREGKSPKKGRFYDVGDYAMVANYNAFRAAHLAIEKVEGEIRKHFKEGDMAEIEVLFGRQPNTVTYGVADKNFIVILRAVNGTPPERVDALAKALNNKTVKVESTIVSSPDGNEIELSDEHMTWEFTQVAPMNAKKIDTSEALALLASLEKFAAQKNDVLPNMSNQEVAELTLTSVPKEQRDAAKNERVVINAKLLNDFKGPIKELLLNKFVRKIKPFLQDKNLHPSEDIGVEGVVVRDPVTGSMTKIVDKDVFTAINTFNSATRAEVAGLVRTTDQDATIEMRGGAFGQAKIRIAELLGAKELAMSSGTKRFVTKFKATTPSATALAVASSLNITSLSAIRTKISAILKNAITEVDKILHSFKEESGSYKLKLKTGKEIGITPEIMKRTLTAFAETKKDIAEVNARVLKSRTSADLVMALYGKTIETLFSGGDTDVKESFSLIRSISEDEGGIGSAAAAGSSTPMAGSVAQTAEVKSNSTTAGNIAPVPFKLMGGKRIIKRLRTFTKPKKFAAPKMGVPESKMSLLKSVNEDWAHVDDMKFAADVDDTAKAKSDIEFNNLRNNVSLNGDVTNMDVNRYLDKAHELNDEVDSVTFGMETDDGTVIKVHVNALQADQFETALGALLGKEDDVEVVVNQLADKFDIIDVEWPEAFAANNAVTVDTDAESDTDADEPVSSDVDASTEDSGDIDFSTASDESSDEEPASDEEAPAEDTPSEDEPEEESSDEEPADEDTPSEDEDEEPTEELDDFGQPISKKKSKKPQEESMNTPGQNLTQRLLAEGRSHKIDIHEGDDSAVNEVLSHFSTRPNKAIISLMMTLGVPTDLILRKVSAFKTAIKDSSEQYTADSSFRTAAKRCTTAFAAVSEGVASTEKQLKTINQRIIFGVLEVLGLTDNIVTSGNKALVAGVRAKAMMLTSEPTARVMLLGLAKVLNVDISGADAGAEMDMADVQYSGNVVMEDAASVDAAVNALLTALGFDLDIARSINSQKKLPAVKRVAQKLSASNTAVAKMEFLTALLTKLNPPKAANSFPGALTNKAPTISLGGK